MLPPNFVEQMRSLIGTTEADALCHAIEQTASPVSLRRNLLKEPATLPATECSQVPWCSTGVYLQKRPKFTLDPLFHAGCYYVQEAASMFVEQAWKRIIEDTKPQRVLDLCAAPGGKSTLWRSLMPDGALLVANEPVRQRAQILAENMTKWGHPDTIVTQAFPEDFAVLNGFFDVVAADVPCSGEGMFRKDAEAIEAWSQKNVETCAVRQWEIIKSVWPALRDGGYLVYSTCTYNRVEDEDMVRRICQELGAEALPLYINKEWQIAGDTTGGELPAYHFFPHRTEGEGFFLTLLRKTSSTPRIKEKKNRKGKQQRRKSNVQHSATVMNWLKDSSKYKLIESDDAHLVAVRESLVEDIERVSLTVRTLTAGILLAEEKGKKLIPQHALAMSVDLSPIAFPQIEISLDQALSYLRHEAIVLPPEAPHGYAIVTYKTRPMGFVNNIGNHANNLYPQEWRIRNQV